jgi:hypothetical protein
MLTFQGVSIRIDHIDGLFDTQNIYLEDKELGIIHNLKKAVLYRKR